MKLNCLAIAACVALGIGQRALSQVEIDSAHLPASTTTNVKSITIKHANLFRYDVSIRVQDKVVDAQKPIKNLSPGSGMLTFAGPSADATVVAFQQEVANVAKRLADLKVVQPINDYKEQSEQASLKQLLAGFPTTMLTEAQYRNLRAQMQNLQKTYFPIRSDTFNDDLLKLQLDTSDLSLQMLGFRNTSAYKAWEAANPSHSATFEKLLNDNSTTSTAVADLLKARQTSDAVSRGLYIAKWRTRVGDLLDTESGDWTIGPVELSCRAEWFGRTSAQIVTLQTVDQGLEAPAEVSASLFVNSCVPTLTVTSGLGITTIRSSTFGFVPKVDNSVTPPTTTQVIGLISDARITPLYVGQMSYEYARTSKGLGFHASGGIGVSSTSNGVSSDFFVGNAFSFVRRAVFVTPSFHLSQRQTLRDGFNLGDPKGSLTDAPVITRWKYGFALTFTFPVLSQ